jgi:type II secretory pathway component PulC
MSIIYEALKKAEGNSPDSSSGQDNHQRKPNSKKNISIILIITFFTAVFILFYNFSKFKEIIFFGFASEQSKTTSLLKQEDGRISSGDLYTGLKSIDRKSETKQSESGYGRLEGIVFDENKPFVIINGRRFYQGDKTGGFTVLKIKPDRVELFEPESKETKTIAIEF